MYDLEGAMTTSGLLFLSGEPFPNCSPGHHSHHMGSQLLVRPLHSPGDAMPRPQDAEPLTCRSPGFLELLLHR